MYEDLIDAIEKHQVATAISILNETRADPRINAWGPPSHKSLLMLAVENANFLHMSQVIERLIDLGADPNHPGNAKAQTPYEFAVVFRPKIAVLFRDKGFIQSVKAPLPSPTRPGESGGVEKQQAAAAPPPMPEASLDALMKAIRVGNDEETTLLINRCAEVLPEFRSRAEEALELAVSKGRSIAVKGLLMHEVDPMVGWKVALNLEITPPDIVQALLNAFESFDDQALSILEQAFVLNRLFLVDRLVMHFGKDTVLTVTAQKNPVLCDSLTVFLKKGPIVAAAMATQAMLGPEAYKKYLQDHKDQAKSLKQKGKEDTENKVAPDAFNKKGGPWEL